MSKGDIVRLSDEAIIVGDGSLARVLTDNLEWKIDSYIGLKEDILLGREVYDINHLPDHILNQFILAILNPCYRESSVEKLGKHKFITITEGNISSDAHIGHGSVIMRDSYIQNNANIGKYTHVHTFSMVGHDCNVGNYSFIGPGAIIGGNVNIGTKVRIGMGANILPKLTIENNASIAAGAIVLDNVPANTIVAGNPAKPVSKTDFNKF